MTNTTHPAHHMADPWQFILDALLMAAAGQDGTQGAVMASLLRHLWHGLSPMSKVSLLGDPAIISLLKDQPLSAEALVVQVEQRLLQAKQDCEQAGFVFYWDPEGYGWHLPQSSASPADDPELMSAFSRLSGDIVELLCDAEQHRQTRSESPASADLRAEPSSLSLKLSALFRQLSPKHP